MFYLDESLNTTTSVEIPLKSLKNQNQTISLKLKSVDILQYDCDALKTVAFQVDPI